MLRDVLISLSLANLCFIKVWSKLLSSAGSYFNEFPIAYASIMANVIILAALFFGLSRMWRRFHGKYIDRLGYFISFLVLVTVANGIAGLIATGILTQGQGLFGRDGRLIGALLLVSIVGVVFVKWHRSIVQRMPSVLLMMTPFVFLTFTQAIWKLNKQMSVVAYAAEKPAERIKSVRKKPATRVVWIIFDELDQRLAFGERPASVKLPELDRFKQQALSASNAYPPAPLTYMSMPALITGRLVSKVTPASEDELLLNFNGEENALAWSREANVFSEARKQGYTTGLAGWCHPYCKVIGGDLTKCLGVKEDSAQALSLNRSMLIQAEGLIGTTPLVQQAATPLIQHVNFINKIAIGGERQKYIARYKSVLENALQFSIDKDLDLILIHCPAPHPPGIYNRQTGDYSLEGQSSYLDNLALVDRTLGELRKTMESNGLWDSTAVLISADHWWRSEMWARGPFWTSEDASIAQEKMDHRIPFVLKLNGQKEAASFDAEFNTVLTHDLLLALLNGDVSNQTDVVQWLDKNRSIGDSPYNRDELLP